MALDWEEMQRWMGSYLEGELAATQALFAALMRVLAGYFRVRIGAGAEAEDLVQVTLLKIHFARDRYDPSRSLKTWVFTIASRSLIDHWRTSSSESEVFDGAEEFAAGADDALPSDFEKAVSGWLNPEQKVELSQDLNRALMELNPLDRSIVYLYGVEGFSMAEIAETLKLTEGAAKLRAHRAYQVLRKRLEP